MVNKVNFANTKIYTTRRIFHIHAFFISNIFISNNRLKLAKKSKQKLSNIMRLSFCYLKIIHFLYKSNGPEVFCKKVFLKILQNSQENPCVRVSFLIKLQAPLATLLKKRLWHRCFPVNFAKFLRTLFFAEHLRWLFLSLSTLPSKTTMRYLKKSCKKTSVSVLMRLYDQLQ